MNAYNDDKKGSVAIKTLKMKVKHQPTVIERFLLPNPLWQEGYRSFNNLFGRPLGWLFYTRRTAGII